MMVYPTLEVTEKEQNNTIAEVDKRKKLPTSFKHGLDSLANDSGIMEICWRSEALLRIAKLPPCFLAGGQPLLEARLVNNLAHCYPVTVSATYLAFSSLPVVA